MRIFFSSSSSSFVKYLNSLGYYPKKLRTGINTKKFKDAVDMYKKYLQTTPQNEEYKQIENKLAKLIFQEFVEALKKNGKFDEATQKEAKEEATKIIMNKLTPELKELKNVLDSNNLITYNHYFKKSLKRVVTIGISLDDALVKELEFYQKLNKCAYSGDTTGEESGEKNLKTLLMKWK